MIKKLIFSVLLFAVSSCVSVLAAENSNIERFYGTHGEIAYSKNITEDMSLLVVKGDKDWAAIKDDTSFLNTNTVFYEYVNNSNPSEYWFNFIVNDEGIYTAYFGDEKTLLVYADDTNNQSALQSLLGCNSTNILSTLDTNYQSLASATSLYSVGNSNAADIIFKYIDGKSEIDRVLFAEAFDKAYLMAGINSGAVTNISDYLYSAGIKGKEVEKYYRPEYATDIYAAVKGRTTITEFDSAIIDRLILNTVSKSNDVSLIKEILTKYAGQIGLNTTYITDSAMRTINKQNYASVDILKTTLATLYNNQNNNQNGQTPPPSGGGGGGGGGYTSPSNQAASNTVGGIGMEATNNSNTTISVFDDLNGYNWAKPAIEGLYQKGIVSGKTVSEFFPADLVSREEFVTMLILATKLNVVAEDIEFLDVPETAWFYEYVNRGYKSKIINGISEEYFGAGMPITRQDMAVMIYNTLNVCGIPLGESFDNTYIDENNIALYAKTAVSHLSCNGIFSGYDDNSFKPLNNASRAEAAVVMFNMVKLMQENKEV